MLRAAKFPYQSRKFARRPSTKQGGGGSRRRQFDGVEKFLPLMLRRRKKVNSEELRKHRQKLTERRRFRATKKMLNEIIKQFSSYLSLSVCRLEMLIPSIFLSSHRISKGTRKFFFSFFSARSELRERSFLPLTHIIEIESSINADKEKLSAFVHK